MNVFTYKTQTRYVRVLMNGRHVGNIRYHERGPGWQYQCLGVGGPVVEPCYVSTWPKLKPMIEDKP